MTEKYETNEFQVFHVALEQLIKEMSEEDFFKGSSEYDVGNFSFKMILEFYENEE